MRINITKRVDTKVYLILIALFEIFLRTAAFNSKYLKHNVLKNYYHEIFYIRKLNGWSALNVDLINLHLLNTFYSNIFMNKG